jgi:hypothetical protein
MVNYAVVNRWLIGRADDGEGNAESRNADGGVRASEDVNVC